MNSVLLYPIGTTQAVRHAVSLLHKKGIPLIDHPAPEITHLLLDVPSFTADGSLRSGGAVEHHLERLPQDITVVGGNLQHPALSGYRTVDFLQDPLYLSRNAAITADCAIRVAAQTLKTTFADTPVLVIGWGRIGKCLATTLKALGAHVTVAARKESDRHLLQALGYAAMDPKTMLNMPAHYRVIFNTVPAIVIDEDKAANCAGSMKIELASLPGIAGGDVIKALGLPGKMVPETSGRLIADTIIRLLKEEEE